VSGKRLSKTEKLELLQRVVLHLHRIGASVLWIPIVTRFIERWDTRGEAPATVTSPLQGGTPLRYRAFIVKLELLPLLSHICPSCGNVGTLSSLDRTESGALRCTFCRDKITTEKKEN
jgi:hypothetical protein